MKKNTTKVSSIKRYQKIEAKMNKAKTNMPLLKGEVEYSVQMTGLCSENSDNVPADEFRSAIKELNPDKNSMNSRG